MELKSYDISILKLVISLVIGGNHTLLGVWKYGYKKNHLRGDSNAQVQVTFNIWRTSYVFELEPWVYLSFKPYKALTHEKVCWRVHWIKIEKNINHFMS